MRINVTRVRRGFRDLGAAVRVTVPLSATGRSGGTSVSGLPGDTGHLV